MPSADDARTVRQLLSRVSTPTRPARRASCFIPSLREDAQKAAGCCCWRHPGLRVDFEANAAGETAPAMAALQWPGGSIERLTAAPAWNGRAGRPALRRQRAQVRAVELLPQRGVRADAPSPNGSIGVTLAVCYGPEATVDLLLAWWMPMRVATRWV